MIGWWGKFVYRFAVMLLRFCAWLLFRMKTEGAANIPRRGRLLLACNHVSHLDPPLVGVGVPRYVFHMAKRELFTIKFLELFFGIIGTIMVHRGQGKQALIDAVNYLEHEECVVIFPEGTRSQTGRLQKGRRGAIVIAIRGKCPILPCAIIGSQKAMVKGSTRIRPVPVKIVFGDPYSVDYDGDVDEIPREVLDRECYRLMEKIEALLPADMRPTPEEKLAFYGEQPPARS